MGLDLKQSLFVSEDFDWFKEKLRRETAILSSWFKESAFDNENKNTGMEVEFWLVDKNFQPAPKNTEFLELEKNSQIVAEISQFNAELNLTPQKLDGEVLSRTQHDLEKLWRLSQEGAEKLGLHAILVGSLPTLRDYHLGLEYLSNRERYRALNSEVMRLRKGKPIHLDIDGKDPINLYHQDIMLEATATSMQSHFQVEFEKIVPYFNASYLATPFLVSLSANSPFLFGHELWDETRIPTFEQAVRLPSFIDPDGGMISRVHFGSGYIRESLFELFLENLNAYPVLLPEHFDEEVEWLSHLRLHNGNIWRWNRPIVGISRQGKPHLRIEQRVPAAGPTLTDMVANHAFYLGLTHSLVPHTLQLEKKLPFAKLKQGFYEAAKNGLSGHLQWIDGKQWNIQTLLIENLIPMAKEGLLDLGVSSLDVDRYIGNVIFPRVRSGKTGASWQKAYVSTHGKDFQGLLAKYFTLQESGLPVHDWTV